MLKWYHDHTGYVGREEVKGYAIRAYIWNNDISIDYPSDDVGKNKWRYYISVDGTPYDDWSMPKGSVHYDGQQHTVQMFSTRGLFPAQCKKVIQEAVDYVLQKEYDIDILTERG